MPPITVEGLADFEVGSEHLQYKGRLIRLDAIRSVQFTATEVKRSANFIRTGSPFTSELYLILDSADRIQIRQESAFRGEVQRKNMEAVWRAAEIISIATFNRRLERYEYEVAEKNFLQIGNYQITKDRGFFKYRERLFGIGDEDVKLALGPFQFYFQRERKGPGRLLFGTEQHVIAIDTDRDCILYVLKHHMGISFVNTPVREKTVDRRQVFLSAVLRLGAKLAKADGRVSREEIRVFKEVFKIDETAFPDATRIFADAIRSSQNVEDIAGEVFSIVGDNRELLEYIALGLIQVASADGVFDKSETVLIRRICDAFGFTEEKTLALFATLGIATPGEEREEQEEERNHGRATGTGDGLAELYLRVLGLGSSASLEEIKIAYRRLAREHHPDTLRARGVPIDVMRHSERSSRKSTRPIAISLGPAEAERLRTATDRFASF